jgi:hypothetical protein
MRAFDELEGLEEEIEEKKEKVREKFKRGTGSRGRL